MRSLPSLILAVTTYLAVTSQATAESECERQKQRSEADSLAAIQRGVEAVGKDDDHAYCAASQQGLATAEPITIGPFKAAASPATRPNAPRRSTV